VLRFFLVKLYMIANKETKLSNYFKGRRVIPDGNAIFSMSEKQFQQMHQFFHFPIQLFDMFSDTFSPLVCPMTFCL